MLASSSLSDRKARVLAIALGLYLVASLTSMAAMSIGVGIFAAVWIGTGAFRSALDGQDTKRYALMALALALACVASLISAWIDPLTYGGKSATHTWAKDLGKLWYLFGPLMVASAFVAVTARARRNLFLVYLGFAVLLGAMAVVQYFTGWPRAQPIPSGSFHRFHAALFAGHHLSVASMIIFPLFMGLGLITDKGTREKNRVLWWMGGLAALAGLITMFLSFARSSWVALPVGLALWLVLRLPWKRALLALTAGGGAMGVAFTLPEVAGRLSDFTHSFITRQWLWELNYKFFTERPWFGVGRGKNQELVAIFSNWNAPQQEHFVGHAHNNFMEMLSGTGLVGVAAWLSFCVGIIVLTVKASRNGNRMLAPACAGLLGAWLVFHLNGILQVNFWDAKVMHQMVVVIGLTLAALRLGREA